MTHSHSITPEGALDGKRSSGLASSLLLAVAGDFYLSLRVIHGVCTRVDAHTNVYGGQKGTRFLLLSTSLSHSVIQFETGRFTKPAAP